MNPHPSTLHTTPRGTVTTEEVGPLEKKIGSCTYRVNREAVPTTAYDDALLRVDFARDNVSKLVAGVLRGHMLRYPHDVLVLRRITAQGYPELLANHRNTPGLLNLIDVYEINLNAPDRLIRLAVLGRHLPIWLFQQRDVFIPAEVALCYCKNCSERFIEHVNERCLWDASVFQTWDPGRLRYHYYDMTRSQYV